MLRIQLCEAKMGVQAGSVAAGSFQKLLGWNMIWERMLISTIAVYKSVVDQNSLKAQMLGSHRKSNNEDIKAGETLFDFLKRKKKFALEQSITRSRRKENAHDNRQSIIESCSPKKNYEDTSRTFRESSSNCQTARHADTSALTPKRVTFTENESKRGQTGRSSFVEMISPMRRRNQEETAAVSAPKTKERDREHSQETFHRKNLNKSVGIMKSTLQKFINCGKDLKSKSHALFVELKPVLKFVEEGNNKNFARRAEELKLKLRTFEHMFKEFDIGNGNDVIQEFHRTLSEHITSMEGSLRSNFQKQEMGNLRRMKDDRDDKINSLLANEAKLTKQLELVERKLERAQKELGKLQKQTKHEQEEFIKTLNEKVSDYENRIVQYECEISQLAIELDNSKLTEKRLEKDIKDLRYFKQEAEKKFMEEKTNIKTAKQSFLINQVDMLKKEFKNDMSQITTLYSSKEQDLMKVIHELKCQIDELRQKASCDQEIYNRILQEGTSVKQQIDKFRKQNECLVTDLHRMNEELYQHWLALKDIKTLSTRLGSFNKFIKIYEDLPFNDQLFL